MHSINFDVNSQEANFFMGAKAKRRTDRGLRTALKAAGGVSALANRLKLTRAAVSRWSKVPFDQILAVEKATGVPRAILRPEMFT